MIAPRTISNQPKKASDPMATKVQLASAVLVLLVVNRADRVAGSESEISNSVVKVSVVLRPPDLDRPWFRQNLVESGGTGVVISGNRILTAAHVVLYASQITVESQGSGEKFPATVM